MTGERSDEVAHGGLADRDGDMVMLGDGAFWWLNGDPWARDAADAQIARDRALVEHMRQLRS